MSWLDTLINRLTLHTELTIADTKRALLVRDGRIADIVGPGRVRVFNPRGRVQLLSFDMVQPVQAAPVRARLPQPKATAGNGAEALATLTPLLLSQHRDLVERHFVAVEVPEGHVAVIRLNDIVTAVHGPGAQMLYWKHLHRVSVEMIDVLANPRVPDHLMPALAAGRLAHVTSAVIAPEEKGVVLLDGVVTEVLNRGPHAYWTAAQKVVIKSVATGLTLMEVGGQELLTADRVTVRVTAVLAYSVADPVQVLTASTPASDMLYRLVQFALRDAVGSRTLDQLLDAREAIGAELGQTLTPTAPTLGLALNRVDVRDFILPGDIRAIMNQVVEADKQAQANLIRRREETAATRSLANTARLMENNPTLLRLKEMELLEKVADKVAAITVHGGLEGVLDHLVGHTRPATMPPQTGPVVDIE